MAKKRKAESQGMDEVERTIFTSFCVAANAISQMYTQTQQQHKIAFQAGERQALEKLYMWLQKEQQQGSNTTVAQVLDHVRSQLEGVSGRDEVAMPPGPHAQPWGFSVPPQLPHHGASGNHQAGGGVGGVSGVPRAPVPGMQRRGAVGGGLESLHEPNSQYARHQDFPTSYNPYSQGGGLPYGHNPPHNQERPGGDDASMDM